jgi:hypothetical protein
MLRSKNFDFDYLKGAFDPAHFMKVAYGLTPDEFQTDVLKSNSKRRLLLWSRQAGKSTVCAALALHRAAYNNSALVLVVSSILRQSQETFIKIKEGLAFINQFCYMKHETQTMLKLSNGSRIVCLPGKEDKIRSFSSVSLLIIDEAARVEDSLYMSVRPMLSISKGDLIVVSTPFGKRGWFYNAWANSNKWDKTKIIAYDCPRHDKDFLEEERAEMGDYWFRQEYLCEFVDQSTKIFSHDLFMESLTNEGEAIVLGKKWED